MNKILLTDEEIEELDINLKVSILAHHALAVKNGRDPTLETSDELFERRKVAKVQLRKVKVILEKEYPAITTWQIWQSVLEEVK